MGSVNQKLKFEVILDNPSIQAGKESSGTITFCLPEAMSNLKLSVGLSGLENVTYLINDLDWHSTHFEYPNKGGALFADRSLDAGFYSFPFTIRTARETPGSMSAEDHCYKASISHWLHAQLYGSNNLLVAQKVPIVIAQRPLANSGRIRVKTKARVEALKMFPRGQSQMKIDMDKEWYTVGERVLIKVTVDNSMSAMSLKSVDLVLHRVVRFEYKTGKKAEKAQVVCSCSTLAKVLSWESSMKSFQISFPLALKKKHLKGCGSAYGSIIKSKYLIEVSANYGTFSSKNKAYVPILVIPETDQMQSMATITDLVEMPPTLIDTN